MLLNGGELDGRRYLSKETCALFTTDKSKISRRGLGFDKPDVVNEGKSPCAVSAPASVYGHTGFTGTSIYVDNKTGVYVVLLTNRVHPSREDNRIIAFRRHFHNMVFASLEE